MHRQQLLSQKYVLYFMGHKIFGSSTDGHSDSNPPQTIPITSSQSSAYFDHSIFAVNGIDKQCACARRALDTLHNAKVT
jgi:hypothetical protein